MTCSLYLLQLRGVKMPRGTATQLLPCAHMVRGEGLGTLVLGVSLLSACQVVAGFEMFEGEDASPPHPCAGLAQSKRNVHGMSVLGRVDLPSGKCLWVDRTEVTVASYREFVAEGAAQARFDQGDLAPVCAGWKQSVFDPEANAEDRCVRAAFETGDEQAFEGTRPIRCVDYCDAAAYCAYQGGALCAAGFYASNFIGSGLPDEWRRACSATDDPYPYGTDIEPLACNIGLSPSTCRDLLQHDCAPVPVGTFRKCESEGIVDAIGNVAEWTRMCAVPLNGGPPTADLPCLYRGGSYADEVERFACATQGPNAPRGSREPWLGFRCCVRLTPSEESLIIAPSGGT